MSRGSGGGRPYLLDTNILVHYVRQTTCGAAVENNYRLSAGPVVPAICIVTRGEAMSLATQWSWGAGKRAHLDALIGHFSEIDISAAGVVDAYAELDAWSKSVGRQMGKNDLWIAAVAKVGLLTLLTTDGDFDHLHRHHITRILLDPNTGAVKP